jgi:hypothetical protein
MITKELYSLETTLRLYLNKPTLRLCDLPDDNLLNEISMYYNIEGKKKFNVKFNICVR